MLWSALRNGTAVSTAPQQTGGRIAWTASTRARQRLLSALQPLRSPPQRIPLERLLFLQKPPYLDPAASSGQMGLSRSSMATNQTPTCSRVTLPMPHELIFQSPIHTLCWGSHKPGVYLGKRFSHAQEFCLLSQVEPSSRFPHAYGSCAKSVSIKRRVSMNKASLPR